MKWKIFITTLLIVAGILFPRSVFASEWYAAPGGNTSASGTKGYPWDLQTALNKTSLIAPGDTVWLRGGTYTGTFTSNLIGTSINPIIVRQYTGERVILDGSTLVANAVLQVNGSYTYYWGFEIMRSDTNRESLQTASSPTDIVTTIGVYTSAGIGNKFINLIIHDAGQGYGFWTPALDAEIYGNLIFYNGWQAPDRGHGHGIYTQNDTGTKTIKDNIIFDQFGWGIHAYTENGKINNFDIDGNIVFNSGSLASGTVYNSNILVGGYQRSLNNIINSNYTYFDSIRSGGRNDLGYNAGCDNNVVTNNYFAHFGMTALSIVNCTNLSMTNNTFGGFVSLAYAPFYTNNTYMSVKPATNVISILPNQYESGRANIVVYNWEELSTVSINPSEILSNNQSYKVYDAQNYLGDPIASGTYTNGSSINISMDSTTVADPIGISAPPHTSSEFGAFILIGGAIVDNSSISTPVSTPSPSGSSLSNSANTNLCNSTQPAPLTAWIDSTTINSVTLQIRDDSSNNVDSHYILYSTTSNSDQYGTDNIGKDALTYTINYLQPNTTYYFRVRAGNGCATGPWSNEISATTKSLNSVNQLDIVSSELTTAPKDQSLSEQSQEQKATTNGYEVKIKVVDTDKKPIIGAKVTLHSTPRETTTDINGVASFYNVESGEHKVLIAYNGFSGEQSVNLTGDVKELDLNVTVQEKAISLTPLTYGIIVTMGLVIIGLIVIIKNKRKE